MATLVRFREPFREMAALHNEMSRLAGGFFDANGRTNQAWAPAVDVWEIEGVSRTRVGARGGIALEWPLGGRFTGSLRATGVVSPSVINTGETPGGVERSSTRRGGVSIGVGYRL